MATAVCT